MEDKVGSFVADKKGNLKPNLDDEAMAAREKTGDKEVKKDGKE